jgi:hypothetical protein
MADGDSIQAGHITAAYTTTDVVAEQQGKGSEGSVVEIFRET